jgi:hypothetical protein
LPGALFLYLLPLAIFFLSPTIGLCVYVFLRLSEAKFYNIFYSPALEECCF